MKASKIARSGLALLRIYAGGKVPLKISHYITYRCNLRCRFCEAWKNSGKDEMGTGQTREAMESFRRMGAVSWSISGGEPFLREDLPELLGYAKSLGYITSVVTNGTFPERIRSVAGNVDLLLISIEGGRKETDFYRGAGTFDKVMRTLSAVKESRINANLNTVIKPDNLAQIKFIIGLAEEYGIFCGFQPVFDYRSGREVEEIVRSPGSLGRLRANIDYIAGEKRRGAPILNSASYLKYIRNYGSPGFRRLRCFAGINTVLLEPDGALKRCYWDRKPVKTGGWEKAFNEVGRPPQGCYCWPKCHGENNLMFSMNMEAVLNAMKKI